MSSVSGCLENRFFKCWNITFKLKLIKVYKNHGQKQVAYKISRPICHPAFNNKHGNTYGYIYGWDDNDIITQIHCNSNTVFNFASNIKSLMDWQQNYKNFSIVNKKIKDFYICKICDKHESCLDLIFACSNGDCFHKKCLYNASGNLLRKCPTCDCEIL